MQIRVANRQDEPAIRAIINQIRALNGEAEVNLKGQDADLSGLETQYFFHDGIFLVAEDNEEIIGLIGARRGKADQELELLRLAVAVNQRGKGIARQMLNAVIFFAENLNYKMLVMVPERHHLDTARPLMLFVPDQNNLQRWQLQVKQRTI